MWLAAAIIALTEGGADGGATALPLGSSRAFGTAAPAPGVAKASTAIAAAAASEICFPLPIGDRYRPPECRLEAAGELVRLFGREKPPHSTGPNREHHVIRKGT